MNVNTETLRLYWRHVRRYKPSFFTMLIAIPFAAVLLYTVLPYILSQAIGALSDDNTDINRYLLLAGGVALAGVSLNLLGFQVAVRHESSVRQSLIDDTFNQLIRRDHDFFANQKIGALTAKFIDFIDAHVGLQDLFIIRTLSFLLTTGTGMVIIFVAAPPLGLLMLGLVAWLLLQVRFSLKIRRPYREARRKLHAEINGVAADAISSNLTVKTFAGEDAERHTLRDITEKYRQAHVKDFAFLSFEGSSRLLLMAVVQIASIGIITYLLTSTLR